MLTTCEIRCHLSVVGESADFIHELSELWPSGEVTHTQKGPVIWRLNGKGPFTHVAGAVVHLLVALDQLPGEFGRVTRAYHTKQWITVAVDIPYPSEMPDGHVSSEILAQMVRHGLALDIDLQLPGAS